ncbi:xanthine dehydrogenase family protein molybdopterin-binding subunit [Sphingobium sp. CECT 9361]|uniref:xanthine dehydrogenase family protein molybdopterin-binding subunit n=1 Tax=Sphingobium sp. CECT 9361 TaxID=2845384 RepID=UPI001E4261D2|nr:xanthine dehydrogenase family protein molybdopterin-binding subunit [Sphingobium sp. CECT 9361]CAH0349889.1 Isoquinoline 1-oxidoreductase subunit beta [Sphingobium sp. CECT 9361]
MNAILPTTRFSRRDALVTGGALVIGMTLPVGGALRAQGAPQMPPVSPNAFIRIAPDSTVTVLIKHIEFGQGPNTGLATLVAEELDADWAQMRAISAPGDDKLYANLSMGTQLTGGSSAMANSYTQMRTAGAMARNMLVAAAARKWGVPAAEVTVTKGVIAHAASGKSGRFGDFAADAATLTPPTTVRLKEAKAFTLIGRDGVGGHLRRVDTVAKTNGTAQFGIDVYEPDMLTVLVTRTPRFGGKLKSFDAAAALKVKGVVAVKQVPTGVAVYGKGMWAAMQGRNALTVEWDDSAAETRSTAEMTAQYLEKAKSPGTLAGKKGDVDAAFAGAKLIEATYAFPYLAHAPMEPLTGFIAWDGKKAETRFGSQGPGMDKAALAPALGISPDAIAIDVMLAGGSFGRRGQADSHFAAELGAVAKAFGPGKFKLIWTREDDIQGGYYRPLTVHAMRGAVKDGKVVGWSNTICGQSFAFGSPLADMMVQNGVDAAMVEGASNLPYALPAARCDVHVDPSPVSTLWWRSVGHTHTGYAVECFIDQLLVAAGQDPIEGRIALLGDKPRMVGVLKAVAKLANWSFTKPLKGRARGVAVVESFSSYVAQIAEVSLNEDGSPRVHKVWCAVDCGVAVNPDVIRAQMEGGIGFGLGHALYAEIPLKKGAPTVTNFDGYRSLRITEMPQVEVMIVSSTEAPTGVGEPGVPPIAPAVANALAALGKARPATLPMVATA